MCSVGRYCRPVPTWGEQVERERRRKYLVPRAAEARVAAFLDDPSRRLLHVRGMPGIGKTALLEHVANSAESRTQLLSAKTWLEPGGAAGSVDLEADLILLDDLDQGGLDFGDLAHSTLAALGDHQKVILASRRALPDRWVLDPGWASLLDLFELEELTPEEASELLAMSGVPAVAHASLSRALSGHPLALRLAAPAWDGFDWSTQHDLRRAFLGFMLDGVSPAERRVFEVAALNRIVTPELVADVGAGDFGAYFRTAESPLVTRTKGGLALRRVLREPLSQEFHHAQPDLRDSVLRRSVAHSEDKGRVGPQERRVFWATNAVELIGHALRHRSETTEATWHRRPVRATDHDEILALVSNRLGPGSAAIARQWLEHAPRGAFVAEDDDGIASFVQFLSLEEGAAGNGSIEDPVVAAFLSAARERGVDAARLARFYVTADETPRGLPFLIQETTAQLLFATDIALGFSAQPSWMLEMYRELAAHPRVAELEVDGQPWSVSYEDLRQHSPEELFRRWSLILQADPTILGGGGPTASPVDPAQLYRQLRAALRAYHDSGRLGRTALAKSPTVRERVAASEARDPIAALRAALKEVVGELERSGPDERHRQVLEATYFAEPRKHFAVAEDLGVGASTHRRHLKEAIERLCELWPP